MGQWTQYYKIIKPSPSKNDYLAKDGYSSIADQTTISNYSWYTQVMKGAGSRMQRYTQYNAMDTDVDVARALDTVAEEISVKNETTELPFNIHYQNDDNKEVKESIVMTIKAALRHWSTLQDLDNRIFRVARYTVKFGDCFFRKHSDHKKWQFIDPAEVIGIELNQHGDVVAYHLRKGEHKKGQFDEVEIIPKAGMIHFTLSDDMGESAPFGESILQAATKAFKQLGLLEDSVVIYRIVRAPERRVFYIDTGNMPPHKVKQYLEGVKNEVRQKRIPNNQDGQDQIDSVYNPMCLSLDTRIPLLDGRTLELNELISEYVIGKQNWVYSCDPISGRVVPGLISWAGVTRKNAEVLKLTLDNGETLITTPDHMIPVLGKGFIRADELSEHDSLISYQTRDKKLGTVQYQQIFDHSGNQWKFTHRMVAEFFRDLDKHQEFTFSPEFVGETKNTVHHVDYDSHNNHPSNLSWMNQEDHMLYHSQTKKEWWDAVKNNPEKYAALKEKISVGVINYYGSLSEEQREKISGDAKVRIAKWMSECRANPEWLADWQTSIAKNGLARKERMENEPEFKAKITKNLLDNRGPKFNNSPINVTREIVNHVAHLVKKHDLNRTEAFNLVSEDEHFSTLIDVANESIIGNKGAKFSGRLTESVMQSIYSDFGFDNWKHFKECSNTYNHRVTKIEYLKEKIDTGCITVDSEHKYHDHHTFATEAGVFVKNSMSEDYFFGTTANGRGSRVETLPGGEQLGEITDLDYFKEKLFRGLRVPTSYMNSAAKGGTQYNDGKVGVAYVEEMRFAQFVKRIQNKIEKIFDYEFKVYLENSNIIVDGNIFKLKLPDPQNFALYRKAALDQDLVNTFSTMKDVPFISARFAMRNYLGFSEDDITTNEAMLRQERKIPETAEFEDITDLQMMYDPAFFDNRDPIKYEPPEEDGGGSQDTDDQDEGDDQDADSGSGASGDTDTPTPPEPDDTGDEQGSKSAVES